MKKLIFVLIICSLLFLSFGCVELLIGSGAALQVMDAGNGNEAEHELRDIWKSAEPFGLKSWLMYENELILILENNSEQNLILNEVDLSVETKDIDIHDIHGDNSIYRVTISEPSICFNGDYNIPKSNIKIKYSTDGGQDKLQVGLANLVGQCFDLNSR
jgi:hypothetical protein